MTPPLRLGPRPGVGSVRLVGRVGLAFALGLVAACGDRILTEGLEEPIAVHDAQFVEGELPGTPPGGDVVAPRATAVTTESTFLRPSLAGVPFFGWATLDSVAVGARIEGLGTGYWVIPTGPVDPQVQGEPVRVWRFVTDFHAIPPGRHRILVAGIDENGRAGSQTASTLCVNRTIPDNANACDPTRRPPELAVTLSWDSDVDLDLSVVTPEGDIVGAKSPAVGLGEGGRANRIDLDKNPPGSGFLDLDSNANCRIDGRNQESVVFDRPRPGTYLVYANLHASCGQKSVRYALTRTQPVQVTPGSGEADPPTFTVAETFRTNGTLIAIQGNGSTRLGTFVAELAVP